MLRVKLSIGGAGHVADLSQFVGNLDNTIHGCRFFVNEAVEAADVWMVSEDIEPWDTACLVPPSRLAFVTSETSWEPGEYAAGTARGGFIDQFPAVYTCHDVYRSGVVNAPPFLPWMINANHGSSMFAPHERDVEYLRDLTHVDKSHALSVFCSAQTLTPNHRMRLRFVQRLKEHFGEDLHWFGNGVNPLAEKWEGIAPYRYTIVLENQSTTNIFTEKIGDAFLGLSYPIYWGAPNLSDFFDRDSFTPINVRDLAGSIATIEQVVASDLAESRQENLMDSKARVLDDYNFFGRLARIAHEIVALSSDETPAPVRLRAVEAFRPERKAGISAAAGRGLMRVGRRLLR